MTSPNSTIVRARELRRAMSLPEGLLWQELRKRPDGLKFRRQHPIGQYVAGFYCPAAKLVIEVDGVSHDMGDRPQRDERRDAWLAEQGYQVIRVTAGDVMRDVQLVLNGILSACSE